MARKKTDTREQVINQLVPLFFQYGYDGTTLSLIAERTGLQRASLYHHFPGGKEEMARAVLQASDRWAETAVVAVVNDASLPPEQRLRTILANLDQVHHTPQQLSPANAFVVGDGGEVFGMHVRQWHFKGLAWLLAELLVACGLPEPVARRRAWEYRLLWEGGLVCARVMGDMGLFRSMMQRMPDYLLSPADSPGVLPADAVLPQITGH